MEGNSLHGNFSLLHRENNMKIKTSELIGPPLNWTVAKIVQEWSAKDRWHNTLGYIDSGDPDDEPYEPSANWRQGGEIIKERKISINYDASGPWSDGWRAFSVFTPVELGPTPLIAAMRSLVASEYGDEVEVPEGLHEISINRANLIKFDYLGTACQASDVEEAVRKLMDECDELFSDDTAAWSFLMEEPNEAAEEAQDVD